MRLTVLVDNREKSGWASEHGLALMLETPEGQLLFDTGAGNALRHNMKMAGFTYGEIAVTVLSHGHFDHTGGLDEVLCNAPETQLYSCSGIDTERWSLHPGMPARRLTMPGICTAAIEKHPPHLVHKIDGFTKITENIYLTGPVERHSFEDCGGPFFLDSSGNTHDMLMDETALLTVSGTLIQGCCHAGIINTMEHCGRHRPNVKIKTIVGGLHLLHSSPERLQKTADYLNSRGVEKVILLHCTGDDAVEFMQRNLDCEVIHGQTGDSWDI